jgi:DNA polymerase bacteriophage-type
MNFLDADYSAIEARIVNWLAGQEDALVEYRQGIDRYKRMAAFIYKVPESQVNKHPQRFVGKQCILGCGFQMGPPKFRTTCKKMGGYDLPAGMEKKAVFAFRAKHPQLVQYWEDIDSAAKQAIVRKNEIVPCKKLSFLHRDIEGMPFLLMKLPSGRKLAYPKPRLVPGKFEGTKSIVFFGHLIGANWGDVHTYGGKLLENATQAVAADLMANGAHNAEREGYEIATLIHDQALAYKAEGQTAERFVELLTALPEWAVGLPLEAEGGEVPFYKKD